jgi:hypothetical protein
MALVSAPMAFAGPAQSEGPAHLDARKSKTAMSFATIMVHVDVARDCEQRVQLALALADRFEATSLALPVWH